MKAVRVEIPYLVRERDETSRHPLRSLTFFSRSHVKPADCSRIRSYKMIDRKEFVTNLRQIFIVHATMKG